MYCKECGKVLSETEKFCPNCGAKIESDKENNQTNLSKNNNGGNAGIIPIIVAICAVIVFLILGFEAFTGAFTTKMNNMVFILCLLMGFLACVVPLLRQIFGSRK
jgi:uncharacterized membrane protein YvbJ